jgi:hypothetical protein
VLLPCKQVEKFSTTVANEDYEGYYLALFCILQIFKFFRMGGSASDVICIYIL